LRQFGFILKPRNSEVKEVESYENAAVSPLRSIVLNYYVLSKKS